MWGEPPHYLLDDFTFHILFWKLQNLVTYHIRKHRSCKCLQVAQISNPVTRREVRWSYQKHRRHSIVFAAGEFLLKHAGVEFSFMLPLCGNVLCLINLFAHMPEKCNSLFNRENWPLTDFHYIYISLALLGMHQLGLCNDKLMDGALWSGEEMHLHRTEFLLSIYLLWRYTISQLEATETQHKDPETQQSALKKRTEK